MPLYDFRCTKCGIVIEEFVKDVELRTMAAQCVDPDWDATRSLVCTFERMVSAPHVVVEEHNRAYNKYGRS